MKRISWLIMLSVLIAAPAPAQRAAPGEGSANTENLGSGIYSVNWGVMGLNVGASVGDDGIILIDDQDQPSVPRLQAELAKISVKPVRIVINSHWHFDHVAGNKIFAMEGAIIIAHANTRTRLMIDQINPANGGKQRAFPPRFLAASYLRGFVDTPFERG